MNYQFFWEGLAPISEEVGVWDIERNDSELGLLLGESFGSFESFREFFS